MAYADKYPCEARYYAKMKRDKPWWLFYRWAKDRCKPRKRNSKRYELYAAKGIEFHLTLRQVELLWRRDKAHLLHQPSLDRIDAGNSYTLWNCRFIEATNNGSRALAHWREK